MDRLPDDMLSLIFRLLPHHYVMFVCSHVCRRWAAVAASSAVAINHHYEPTRLHRGLRSLHLGLASHILDDALNAATRIATNLRYLTVHSAAPLTNEQLEALKSLPNLYHLDVFYRSRIIDERSLPVLRRLGSFVINNNVATGVLARLASEGAGIEALHMYGSALHYPRPEMLATLRVGIDRLRELTLRCTELNDRMFEAIGSCTRLTSLQLYSCWLMREAGAASAVRPPLLRRLHVTGARMLRTEAMFRVITLLPASIEELVLSATCFGTKHVAALVRRVPNLRVLELWRCPITPQDVLHLVEGLPVLEVLDLDLELLPPQLKSLAAHPTLRMVRCKLVERAHVVCYDKTDDSNLDKKLNVISVTASFRQNYFRVSGEGFRASLYYYWTQDIDLKLVPNNCQPCIGVRSCFPMAARKYTYS